MSILNSACVLNGGLPGQVFLMLNHLNIMGLLGVMYCQGLCWIGMIVSLFWFNLEEFSLVGVIFVVA